MKKFSISLAVICLFIQSVAIAGAVEQRFLQRLGFENLVQQINHSLAQAKTGEISRIALLENREKYAIVNEASELSIFIYDRINKGLGSSSVQEQAVRLTSHFLRAPIMASKIIAPEYFKEIGSDDRYRNELESYRLQSLRESNSQEVKLLTNYTAQLIQQASGGRLDASELANLKNVLQKKYTNYFKYRMKYQDIAGTSYLGRAMTALLVRHARLQRLPFIETKLNYYLSLQGDYLNNYVASQFSMVNRQGQLKKIYLKSGDFAHKYSNESDSFLISVGVSPGNRDNEIRADQYGLVNSMNDFFKFPTPNKFDKIKDKIDRNIPLTSKEEELYLQTRRSSTGLGFSHVGLVEVKVDPETGIAMPWIWDVYPTGGLAGGRFVGMEGFAQLEKTQKIGFSRYSASAFMNYYHARKQQEGYLINIWKTHEGKVMSSGNRVVQTRNRVNLHSTIGEEEMFYLRDFPMSRAQAWYDHEITPRVMREMKAFVVSPDAVLFAKKFINLEGAMYCSQAIVLAYLRGVNIDPQVVPDKWKKSVAVIGRLVPQINSKLDLGERIISPSGFMWQAGLTNQIQIEFIDSLKDRKNNYSNNFNLLK